MLLSTESEIKLCSCEHFYVFRIKPWGFVIGLGNIPFGVAVVGVGLPGYRQDTALSVHHSRQTHKGCQGPLDVMA